jgi:hypothetical protein
LIAVADDVNGEATDIGHGEAVDGDQREQIHEACAGLLGRIGPADGRPIGVDRHLAGDEQPIIESQVGGSVPGVAAGPAAISRSSTTRAVPGADADSFERRCTRLAPRQGAGT